MLGNADILTALKVDTSSIVHSKIKYVGFKNTLKICTLACNNHEGRFFQFRQFVNGFSFIEEVVPVYPVLVNYIP